MGYSALLNDFKDWVTTNKEAQSYWSKVNKGTATYTDATHYSELVGDKWSELILKEYGPINDEIKAEIVESLSKAYSESAYYSKNVQKIINDKAKVGMKVLEPAIDETRIKNLLDKLAEDAIEGKDARWLLDNQVVENISRSAVTDTIEANGRIQSEAGLATYVTRNGVGCCDWCASVSGTFKLGEQPSDFWKVHKGCNCIIDYKVDKSPIQKIRFASGRKITS